MQKFALLLLAIVLWSLVPAASLKAQTGGAEFIDLQITSAYSPEELNALIQKLGKRGILLRFEETGYCNGELRILKGEIIGSDGSRFHFETKALRSMRIRLVAQTKALGVQAVRLKNRWRKCKENEQQPSPENDGDPEYSQPVQQI